MVRILEERDLKSTFSKHPIFQKGINGIFSEYLCKDKLLRTGDTIDF